MNDNNLESQNMDADLNPEKSRAASLLRLGLSSKGDDQSVGMPGYRLPNADELNEQFPQLEVHRLIGRGGMGAIYHARQKNLDRDVALKIIAREISGDTAFLDRFEREAKALAKLSHPGIVTVFDYGHTIDGLAYLTMEYVDGYNLREAINMESMTSENVVELLVKLCDALEYAHQKGIVHRDIKPENVLVSYDGSVKIADFGIAKVVDKAIRTPTLTATQQVLGSLHYLAPEHLESPTEADHRVDLYGIGVVAYELLTKQLPLGRFEPPSQLINDRLAPELAQQLDAIILKLLERKPSKRYQSASEVIADLRDVGLPPVAQLADEQPSASKLPISIPFKIDPPSGLYEVLGMIYATNESVRFEFRKADSIFGQVKSKLIQVEIPKEKLTRFDIVSKLFTDRLHVSADRVSTIEDLPNSESGVVELKIKKQHGPALIDMARLLGFEVSGELEPIQRAVKGLAVSNEEASQRFVFAVLLILCGIMNAGALGIAQVFISKETAGFEQVALIIATGVCIGPLAALQIIAGLVNLFLTVRPMIRVACIVSCLPLTPVFLLSIPLAIFGWRTFFGEPTKGVQKAGWGSTTMMYIRESRWSKTVAAANIALGLFAALALAVYWLEVYPATLRYRIVGATGVEDFGPFETVIKERIDNDVTVHIKQKGNRRELVLTSQKRQVNEISNALAIEKPLTMVWLKNAETGTEAEQSGLVLAPGISFEPDAVLTSGKFGVLAQRIGEPVTLDASSCIRVSGSASKLTIQLEKSAREKLTESLKQGSGEVPNEKTILALVSEDVIEGIATIETLSRDVEFNLAAGSQVNSEALVVALRSSPIPFALERIE